ncbi:MAG TPA: tyrosine-type recombinase/integrase [Chloroflexota bacterium]|nr:tyrosine-type recombinase/integrase [Chloroflexota bacterium]
MATRWAGWSGPRIDLDTRTWTIPKEKAKNGRAHEVHLSDIAIEIIQSLPQVGRQPRFVLTTNGTHPVSGFSKSKARLDAHILDQLRDNIADARRDTAEVGIEPWILHDLRRTAATGMAKLNIAPHVVDRILNHVSGTIRGVAAVYNRHAYIEERTMALDAWGRYLERLVRPGSDNVLHLTAAR